MLNEETINNLAYEYSRTRDQFVFRDLFFEMYPFLRSRALRAYRKALQRGLHIPSEDFESQFGQALYQSSLGYDYTLGGYLPRLQFFIKLREADVWRSYRTQYMIKSERKTLYLKAQYESLDRNISDDGGDQISLGDVVLPHVPSAESEYLERENVNVFLNEFRKMNSRYASVILLLGMGGSNSDLARAAGEEYYNPKVRKLVQRSKSAFNKYLISTKKHTTIC